MTLKNLIKDLNFRIAVLKHNQKIKNNDHEGIVRISGHSSYGSGYSQGYLDGINEELVFINKLLGNEE